MAAFPGNPYLGKIILYVTTNRPRSANVTTQRFAGEPIPAIINTVDEFGTPEFRLLPNKNYENLDGFAFGDQIQAQYGFSPDDAIEHPAGSWCNLSALAGQDIIV